MRTTSSKANNTPEDKVGNDKSDELVGKGVEPINGSGLARLGKWLPDRYDNCKERMMRSHKMIATVVLAGRVLNEITQNKCNQSSHDTIPGNGWKRKCS